MIAARIAFVSLGFNIAAVLFITSSVLIAWTGPASTPPNTNTAPPLNVGSSDQTKDGAIWVKGLAVEGNTLLYGASRYLNFGSTAGETGYGIRDNAGTIEAKNALGTWSSVASVPIGAIMAFDLTVCPPGWTEYVAARGRFLRGIAVGTTTDPDGPRPPGSIQDDALQDHGHKNNYDARSPFNGYGSGGNGWYSNWAVGFRSSTADVNPPFIQGISTYAPTGATSPPRKSSETRPKNVAVLFCRKV